MMPSQVHPALYQIRLSRLIIQAYRHNGYSTAAAPRASNWKCKLPFDRISSRKLCARAREGRDGNRWPLTEKERLWSVRDD